LGRRKRIVNTRLEIIQVGTRMFLEEGFTATSASKISKELGISLGNLTFHFPTKEHLLEELIEMLCDFQWEILKREADKGLLRAVCLELAAMAAICEENENARNFYLSAYTHSHTLDIIRRNDREKAKMVYGEYCKDWSETQFIEAENLVSGIEYSTLAKTSVSASVEVRLNGALNTIMGIYNVPKEISDVCIKEVLSVDYYELGRKVLEEFKKYVSESTKEALIEAEKKTNKK